MLALPYALAGAEQRSLAYRVWELFGGPPTLGSAPILLQRAEVLRPFWRVESNVSVTYEQAAAGWSDGTRAYLVGYFASTLADRNEKVERLTADLRANGGVWFRAFGAAWLKPEVETVADPLGLPPGGYTVSCSVTNHHDEETLASEEVAVTLGSAGRLRVLVPAWPYQHPIAKEVRVYVAAAGGVRRLAGSAVQVARGWSVVTVTALPPGSAALEPTESVFRLGALRAGQVMVNTYESPDRDGEFDGLLTVRAAREVFPPPTLDQGRGTYDQGEVRVSIADGESLTGGI